MSNQRTGVLFDSDVLLKLGQHPANKDTIGAIKKAARSGNYALIVPEPVMSAFNQERAPAEHYKKSSLNDCVIWQIALEPRPSSYGGWSYHKRCPSCAKHIDTGEAYDD